MISWGIFWICVLLIFENSLSPTVIAQLELARQKATQVALKGMGSAAKKAAMGNQANSSRSMAEQAAERLNAKLGYNKQEAEAELNEANGTSGSSAEYIRRLVNL